MVLVTMSYNITIMSTGLHLSPVLGHKLTGTASSSALITDVSQGLEQCLVPSRDSANICQMKSNVSSGTNITNVETSREWLPALSFVYVLNSSTLRENFF